MAMVVKRIALLMLLGFAVIDSVTIPNSQVSAIGEGTIAEASTSEKYLVASFPVLRQVAYVHLPDTVWRPLVIGAVDQPKGVAVDPQLRRLFVADPPNSVIWWYNLATKDNGLLETIGLRHCAVEGFRANYLSVNFGGDLYFTGRSNTSSTTYDSIYRHDVEKIAIGNSLNPYEVYSRTNTGHKAWVPSGLAVDSFFIYWGNLEDGQEHGSVCKGPRRNIGVSATNELQVAALNNAVDEVRGLTVTGTHIFWLSPSGVYGMSKTTPYLVSDAAQGLIAVDPGNVSSNSTHPWDPSSISWDGDNSLYLTDIANGVIYILPAMNVQSHLLMKFVDAPNIADVAVMSFHSTGAAFAAAAPSVLVSALAATIFAVFGYGA